MAARGVNKVILVGHLGQDPDVRYMPNGGAVASLTLATSEMPALAWISLPHHFPVRKTATTSIQTAVHAAMNTVKWLHVLKV